MGARGPKPKDPERRQRERTGDPKPTDLALLPSRFALPDPPEGLLPATKEAWTLFWGSELGRMADPDTDGPALRRLFHYRDEFARLSKEFDSAEFEPFTKGSTGQMVMNPLYKALGDLEKQILALEDRFGLNVRQRIALGASVVDTAKTLAEVNQRQREQRNPEPSAAPVDLATDEG